MNASRSKLYLLPKTGDLVSRYRKSSLLLAMLVVTAHLLLGTVAPSLGPATGALLAIYSSGVGSTDRGLNFELVQYIVLALTLWFLAAETRAAYRHQEFPREFDADFLYAGSAWQVARVYFGLAFVGGFIALLALADVGGNQGKYDRLASTQLGAAMLVTVAAHMALMCLRHFAWMAVYLVHPGRRSAGK